MKVGLPDLSKKRYFCFTFFFSNVLFFSDNFFRKIREANIHSFEYRVLSSNSKNFEYRVSSSRVTLELGIKIFLGAYV